MENFTAYNPVRIHFGKDACSGIGHTASEYGKRALLVYGQGSIIENGIYDQVVKPIKEAGIEIFEYSGIRPNPRINDVNKAVRLGIENKVDMVIAVGGGSVIDSAKIIAVCIPENLDGWQVMTRKQRSGQALPLISVLTLAATGTEMNMFAVVQNPDANEKIGFGIPLMFPKHSFLDPVFTATVSKEYTAYGITDLIAHALENFFGDGGATLADRFVIAIVKEAIETAPMLLNDLANYELRAKILWASTCALNGTTFNGRKTGDWTVHALGHTLSLLYDMPHGATLSVVYPAWLRFLADKIPGRIEFLGRELFGLSGVDQFILKLEEFFTSINSPVRLQQAGIGIDKKSEIINHWLEMKPMGMIFDIDENGYRNILDWMYES